MTEENIEFTIAEIEISYKSKMKVSGRPILKNSKDVAALFSQTWDSTKIELVEQFKVLLLNRANRVLGICTLTTGNVSGTISDPKQVFSLALKANATSVVIAHNHPSGNTVPSKADEEITQRMKMAGQYLDIKVLDHLIITLEGYYSFADEGLL